MLEMENMLLATCNIMCTLSYSRSTGMQRKQLRTTCSARAWLAMMPFSTASPSGIGRGSFSALICSSRLNSSGATAAMDANFGWLCAHARRICKFLV